MPSTRHEICRPALLAALLLIAVCQIGLAQPVPLNSSVLIYDRVSLIKAPEVVDRIAALGDRRVVFVVTLHCRLSPELRPLALGLMSDRSRSWSAPDNFEPLSSGVLSFYQSHLTAAIRRAVSHGMDIAILPHLDPAGQIEEWRNHYDFDPQEMIAGHSYDGALIDVCTAAVAASTDDRTQTHFSLGGEMGRSAFAHPAAYCTLLAKVRGDLKRVNAEVGLSLNHNDLAGGHEPTADERRELQRLFADCDFVGFSNYAPFDQRPTPQKFSRDCERFLARLKEYGIELPKDTPLHFSEIGLGGAPDKQGAVSVDRAMREPWEGASRPHKNPWTTPAMVSLRRDYYSALLSFLRDQPGPRRVDAAYLWSEGSWEPLGVFHPAFADEATVRAVQTHNAKARAHTGQK